MHLRGGMQLLNLLPLKTAEGHMLKQFFVMYFVAHDIMGRTAMEDSSEAETLENAWLADDNLEEVRDPSCFLLLFFFFKTSRLPPWKIDMLMGCSRGLMSLISKISNLATEKSKVSVHFRVKNKEKNKEYEKMKDSRLSPSVSTS